MSDSAIDVCHALGCREVIYPNQLDISSSCRASACAECGRLLCASCTKDQTTLCAQCAFDQLKKLVEQLLPVEKK